MQTLVTYDVVGIGLGPFGLGLAALTQPLVDSGEITAAFYDQRDGFCWHPGMMFDEATIQVPFLADLVTLADPTSPYSFLNYLKLSGRMHRFYIREDFYPLRREYSDYCAWVDDKLSTTHWNTQVTAVKPAPQALVDDSDARWVVEFHDGTAVAARHLVSAVGTTPFVPKDLASGLGQPHVVHSEDFLEHRDELLELDSVTIVGSGQSAAEIFQDLLPIAVEQEKQLNWVTRSPRFFPMEYTKLTLEMTSPEYAQYFASLPDGQRDQLNRENRGLYKGISEDLINDIYDTLYRLSISNDVEAHTLLKAGVSVSYVESRGGTHTVRLHHNETGTESTLDTQGLVLATGYRAPQIPAYLVDARDLINLDSQGRYDVAGDFSVDDAHSMFVLNAEEHVFSLNAPDLGMGPWRNSIIVKQITGREVYPIERAFAFQHFGGLK